MTTVEVTGAGGFLGQHVVRALRAADYAVMESPRVEPGWAPSCSMVVHCAARCGGIGFNAGHGYQLLTENLRLNDLVVTGCIERGAQFVALGSVCAYPRTPPLPFREDDLWSGYPESTNAPYGIAKRVLIEQCMVARREHGLRCVVLIPTNLYGPGDHFEPERSHVVPAMIQKISTPGHEPVSLWGTGLETRDLLYVEDAAAAVVAAVRLGDCSCPINIGTGTETAMAGLVEEVRRALGQSRQVIWTNGLGGQPRRVLDTARARTFLGWEASTALADGLRRTIKWYRCAH